MEEKYFTRKEAADYLAGRGLPVTKGTLGKFATVGGGPVYQIFGSRCVYTQPNLDAWAEARLSAPRSSTTQPA